MKLYFIRHTSVDVPEGVCYGQSDVPLKPSFEVEAEQVKLKLQNVEFDAILSSPLSRCHKLAQYCGFRDIQLKDRLKEMHFGDWEMTPWAEIQSDDIDSWYSNWVYQPTLNGESFKIQYDRVASLLDELKQKNYTNVALFSHAGVINCARVYFRDTTLEDAFKWTPQYGEIVNFDI